MDGLIFYVENILLLKNNAKLNNNVGKNNVDVYVLVIDKIIKEELEQSNS